MTKPTDMKDHITVIWMIAVLVIPAFLALWSVQIPGELVFSQDPASVSDSIVAYDNHKPEKKVYPPNCTPYGYTLSLSLFIVPSLVIGCFLHFSFTYKVIEKSFWLTIVILVPMGFLLDLILGNLFFYFPNQGANLGIFLPGFDFEKGAWIWDLPIEEFVFYASGFIAILSIHMWCEEIWFGAYNKLHHDEDPKAKVSGIEGIFKDFLHLPPLIIGAILIAAAVLYKKFGPHEYQSGFPGYFIFLVALSVIPAVAFARTAIPFINWRAFSATLFFVLLISLIWEATLASPYGWWRYNNDQMMGLVIKPWSSLPIEASLLWLSVNFTATIVYKVIKIWLISGKPFRKFFLGKD